MSIIYSVIIKNKKTVLCEFTESSGNFQQISCQIVQKIELRDNSDEFYFIDYNENYKFYILNIEKTNKWKLEPSSPYHFTVTFICLVKKDNYADVIIHEYLESIKNIFFSTNDENFIYNALSYSMSLFIEVFKREMKKYNKKIITSSKEQKNKSLSKYSKGNTEGKILDKY
jgi:hypothetical protein